MKEGVKELAFVSSVFVDLLALSDEFFHRQFLVGQPEQSLANKSVRNSQAAIPTAHLGLNDLLIFLNQIAGGDDFDDNLHWIARQPR